ncbi:unnamed protein product [Ectocarpus sp. 4 AP-2014]
MNNCYTPRAAPAQNDGKSKRRDRDGKAPNGTATKEPSLASTTRGDGRAPYDMRQVYMDVGVVAHATGSAYVEFNHTKVICAVYGPHAQTGGDSAFSEEGQLQCDFCYAPFAMPGGRREARGGKKDDERELSTLLRQTLESSIQVHRLTKSVVGVHVMVLQADGGELAVATTCASMALADAGIELYDLVTACSVGYCGTQMVLDPTKEEAKSGAGVMTIALMPGTQQVTQWWQEGRFDGQKVAEALELCTDGCGCVHKMMEAKLKASTTKK